MYVSSVSESLEKESKLPPHVLIAEDEFLIRLDLAESVRDLSWPVVEVSSADEGLQLLRQGVAFDLLVTDLNMPGSFKGLDLARHLRIFSPRTKIVAVSAEPELVGCEEHLFDLVLRKPVWDLGSYLIPLVEA
jgi:CheY-like chemotaxis protein